MAYNTLSALCADLTLKARQPVTAQVDFNYHFTETYMNAHRRILTLDPAPFYERLGNKIDAFSRGNFNFGMEHLFPVIQPGYCGCGCGQILPARRSRWATPECSYFANSCYSIIAGKSQTIKRYVDAIAGSAYSCMLCGEVTTYATAVKKRSAFGGEITHEIDHIVPVILGGGGCWLSNYQQICVTCHNEKSAQDKALRRQYIRHVLAPGNELF